MDDWEEVFSSSRCRNLTNTMRFYPKKKRKSSPNWARIFDFLGKIGFTRPVISHVLFIACGRVVVVHGSWNFKYIRCYNCSSLYG